MKTAALLLALALPASAQSARRDSQNEPFKFSAHAEVVTVPVVVSRHGRFVPGLKAADFRVLEDGKPQMVASFEEITATGLRPELPSKVPGEFSNAVAQQQRPVAVTVILIDRLFTPFLEQNNARKELLKFLANSVTDREPTMLAVVTNSGLRIIHNFTSSREVLLAALKRVHGTLELGPNVGDVAWEAEANGANSIGNTIDVAREANSLADIMTGGTSPFKRAMQRKKDDSIEKTLLAFEQLALGLRGVPGRKTLIWVSPGFACSFFGPSVKNLQGQTVTMGQQCVDTWRALSAANFALYLVNPTQTDNPTYTGPGAGSPRTDYHTDIQRELMNQSLTTYTGGVVCSYRNNLDDCYRRAVDDSSHYYMLTYYARPTEKPAWRKIQVKVDAPDVSVRTRSGYMTAGTTETWEQRRKNDIAVAVASPLDYTGIPLTVKWLGITENSGKKKAAFEIRTGATGFTIDESDQNHFKLNLLALAVDPELTVVADYVKDLEARLKPEGVEQIKKFGFVYKGAIDLPEGEYTIKFIVRDDLSGRMGTVTASAPPNDQAPAHP